MHFLRIFRALILFWVALLQRAIKVKCGCANPSAFGLESGLILDDQLTASSQWPNAYASYARLNWRKIRSVRYGCWIPKISDEQQWLMIDFIATATIVKIKTQGRDDHHNWIKSFTLSFGNHRTSLEDFQDPSNGQIKEFSANHDRNTVVENVISPIIVARYLRINPTSWFTHQALRMELYGCYNSPLNPQALGMEDGRILDSQISSSSEKGVDFRPQLARLNLAPTVMHKGVWVPRSDDNDRWLKIDFLTPTLITKILTQGKIGCCWTRTFTVSLSNDNIQFHPYQENSQVKSFVANNNGYAVVQQNLNQVILARYIRIHPELQFYIGMRIEFFGKRLDWFNPTSLGMKKNGLIVDSQITASSSKYLASAVNGRLFSTSISNVSHGGWIPSDADNDPWLQVDFIVNVTVTTIYTQGSFDKPYFVKNYTIAFGYQRDIFEDYKVGGAVKSFFGNLSPNGKAKEDIDPHFKARFVRIKPAICYRFCALRIDFYGRYEGPAQSSALGMESRAILDSQLSSSNNFVIKTRPALGRLNSQNAGEYGDWGTRQENDNIWLQVDFLTLTLVHAIVTQGRHDAEHWVTAFQVFVSYHGNLFQKYENFGVINLFLANYDQNTTIEQRLAPIIITRSIRLIPKSWQNAVSMRVEFIGQYIATTCMDPEELGMENSMITNSQIAASSIKDKHSRQSNARLNFVSIPGKKSGAWVASDNDTQPWIQVDFKMNLTLKAISTQGREDAAEWVTSYKVSYGTNASFLQKYTENGQVKVFIGNENNGSIVKNDIFLYGRIVRVEPKSWHGGCALRLEFYGCYDDCEFPQPLGIANNSIRDSQLNASSSHPRYPYTMGRLNLTGDEIWRVGEGDTSPWLQVDFLLLTKISGVITQGQNYGGTSFVIKYKISYCNNGVDFQKYREYSHEKSFIGNFDGSTALKSVFARVILAQFVRLHPTESYNGTAMRVEFLGCFVGCQYPKALGMENRKIKNAQIKSSSHLSPAYAGSNARLHNGPVWIPKPYDKNKRLIINFMLETIVCSISTQGRGSGAEFVINYTVSYSNNGVSFTAYRENGIDKVFEGNKDSRTVVTNMLTPAIVAQYICIHPKKINNRYAAMKVELNGCYPDLDVCDSMPCQNGGSCVDKFDGYNSFVCICAENYTGVYCESKCMQPHYLGMANGFIRDSQISASGSYDDLYKPSNARLNNTMKWKCGCWAPQSPPSINEWFQVDFRDITTVSAIATQGNQQESTWVTKFQVSYSDDGISFVYFSTNNGVKTFIGNMDNNTPVKNKLRPMVTTRFIRINPTEWKEACTLRAEFYGCFQETSCPYPKALGMESGRIKDDQITSSSFRQNFASERFLASNGRLNALMYKMWSVWIRKSVGDWLQVDFLTYTTVSAILTQGRNTPSNQQWVTQYSVRYGIDLQSLEDFMENGVKKYFKGNVDRNTVVRNSLVPHIITRYIRIYPEKCERGACSLRVEFLGCYEETDACASSPCLNNATCHHHFDGFNRINCTCQPGYTGIFCETDINECISDPCQHGGICNDHVNSYNCSCSRDFNGTHCEYEIIYPIQNFTVLPLSVHKFGEIIPVTWEMDVGTNVSAIVYYNDFPCCNASRMTHVGGTCNCSIFDSAFFDADGVVDIQVYAWNSVSNEKVNVQVEVQKEIQNASISIVSSDSTFGNGVEGDGSIANVFPAKYPVKISLSYLLGPAKTALWSFNCSVSGEAIATEFSFEKTFASNASQYCDVSLQLRNNISEVLAKTSFVLKETLIITSLTSNAPVKLNKTMTFTISFERIGTGSCLWVDLGDNSSLLIFGATHCATKFDVSQINTNIVSQPHVKFSFRSPDTQKIEIDHLYSGVGSYNVRVNASNEISVATESMVAVVLALECYNPNVTITGLTPNSSNVLNAVQVYRSVPILLSSEQEIDCEVTRNTKLTWSIFKFEDDPQMLNTVPTLTVRNLRKSVFRENIDSTELLISSRELPYGFYEFAARLEMMDLPDVFGTDVMYVEVVQTPWLEAAVTAGSFYTVPYGLLGSLNASASLDPDFYGTEGLNFSWYCRDVHDKEFLLTDLNKEPLLSFPELTDDMSPITDNTSNRGGCFGTGRGQVNNTSPLLEIDTRVMVEDKAYAISLVISTHHPKFGLREDITNIFFYVAKGLPPDLHTSCVKNCKSKVNPDEKIILTSFCNARCYGELTFIWSLYIYDDINMPEPYNLTDLNEIPRNELENMASKPLDELDIAIKPNTLKTGKKYIVAFRATRPSGVYGELRYTMLINSPPAGGSCTLAPQSGTAMETNFTISCENWVDTETPLTYEFLYVTNGVRIIFFYETVAADQKVATITWLPVGDEINAFKLNVSAQVKDSLGAKSMEDFIVEVFPPPEGDSYVKNLDSLITSDNNQIELMFKNGQGMQALSFVSSLGSVLNYISRNMTNIGNDTGKLKKHQDKSSQVRQLALAAIMNSNVTAQDFSSFEQISAAVLTLTQNEDELLPGAQDSAITISESLATSLQSLSNNDNGFVNVKRGAKNVIGAVGQITSSVAQDAKITASTNSSQTNKKKSSKVKRSFNVLGKIQNVLLDNLVTTEGPVNVESEKLSIQVEKVMLKSLGQRKNSLKNCDFQPPGAEAVGLDEIVQDPNNTVLQMQAVNIKMAVFDNNPFTWDNSSQTITSNVVDIVLDSKMNMSTSNFSNEAFISVARDSSQFPAVDSFYLKPSLENETANTKEFLKYHCLSRSSNYTSINFELQPEDVGIAMVVYIKKGQKPDITIGDFDHLYELPDLSSCKVNNDIPSHHSLGDEEDVVYINPSNCSRDPYTVFVPNTDLNGTGEYCFAVQYLRFLNTTDTNMATRQRRSVSCEIGARRVRRSCVIIPQPPPKPTYTPPVEILVADNLGFDGKFFFPNQTPNYNLTMFESSCMHWNVENETWTGDGCRVAVGTNRGQILCYCSHLTSFGSDLLVAPNPIDFDSVFKNFGSLAENVAVLALISTILGVYITCVIWARRADKKDLLMVGPTILSKPKGSHHYLITTHTGNRLGAGTTARVVFTMYGDDGETQPVRLRDRRRPCFTRGQENQFVVSYPQGIGDFTGLKIWHDNSGLSPSWYLSRMSVTDLQTGQVWPLFCENWLAVESEDGKVCRVLHVASEEETISFGHLFSNRALKGLADGHIWFSIVSRPPTSNFTRVQRLSCALCLLCCTMITSAMFYNMGGQGPSPFAVHIGSLVIDLKPFVIGLQSSIIIVPVNVLLVQIFRNLKPKNSGSKYKITNSKVENKIYQERAKAKKGKLPHLFIFIAYAICYLASAASIFFTLLYSIQWGKETSTEWVIAMVTSFLQSVLLLQPIKVVLLAVVFAFLIRKPLDSEEKSTEFPVVSNQRSKNVSLKKKIKKYYSPPDPKTLRKARQKRLKELKMNAALTEMFTFFVFLILLMDVAQYHRDPNTFLLTKTLYETFEDVDSFAITLDSVSDIDSLWMWSRETLVPGLYAGDWYNGKKSGKGWIGNMEDYLVGVARLRLLRVEKDSCTVTSYFEDSIPHCFNGYSVVNEDEESYAVSWLPLHSSRKRRDIQLDARTEHEWLQILTGDTEEKSRTKRALDPIQSQTSGRKRRKKQRLLSSDSPKTYTIHNNAVLPGDKILSCLDRWRHQTMVELRGFPYWGTMTMYSGSGYVANLGYDQETAYTVIADLHSNGWIDVQTRAVLVEFTVYNANTNLFGMVSIFIEFPPSSGAFTKTQYEAARFYLRLSGGQTVAHVFVVFFMLYFLYREGKLIYKQRLAYFKGFWNWVEIILIVCEFLLIILFLARLYEVDRNLLQLRKNPNDYVGFQYAGNVDALMTYVIGILVFFYILRFLRLLRFNKNFLVIGKTLSRISAPILSFCVPFIFGFFAFALFAFSVFSSELEDYSSFARTMVTQLSMTLGDFDFQALFIVNPLLATLYFFAFIGLNVMVLMNMFIAIINDSYAEIQDETSTIENEFEILEYVNEKLVQTFYGKLRRGKVSPLKKPKRKQKKKVKKIEHGEERYLHALNLCEARLGKLIESVEIGLQQEEDINAQFCSVPSQNKDVFFQVLCQIESISNEDVVCSDESELSDSTDDLELNV